MSQPIAEADQAMTTRVGLVGCVKSKLTHASPAADLYTSLLFRGRRAYVERSCERWLVLSALHGAVRPDVVLEPYDVTLNDASRTERRAWASRVLGQLESELGSLRGLTVEIHAGANYTDWGLVEGLRERGATVEQPLAGLSLGQQLAFYAAAGLAQPDPPAAMEIEVATPVVAASLAPDWEERDAWGAIADLDEHPTLVRACDWPADLTGLDHPGLYTWWVDDEGATDLEAGLGTELTSRRIYAGQAGATRWPSARPPATPWASASARCTSAARSACRPSAGLWRPFSSSGSMYRSARRWSSRHRLRRRSVSGWADTSRSPSMCTTTVAVSRASKSSSLRCSIRRSTCVTGSQRRCANA